MQCKVCNRFFTILWWPRMPIDLELLQVCQFMYMVDYMECLHCQQLFCYQNQFCNVPLNGHYVNSYQTSPHKFADYQVINHKGIWLGKFVLFWVERSIGAYFSPTGCQNLFVDKKNIAISMVIGFFVRQCLALTDISLFYLQKHCWFWAVKTLLFLSRVYVIKP